MKKVLVLVLALVMAMGTLTGFAAAEEAEAVVRACIGSQPETLDPQLNSASDGSNYIKHLFEGLMRYNWDGTGIGLGAAESYEISEDGLTWTFKIREDAKWSDGQDLVAEDFVYTWRRLVDPATAAPYASDMGSFILNGLAIVNAEMTPEELGVTAIDEKTLEVKLAGPCGFFDQIMAFPAFYPVRKDVVEASENNAWVTSKDTIIGNGAYTIDTYTMDEELILVPNENYFEADKLIAKKIVFKFISEPNSVISALRSGEIDWADNYPLEELETIKAEGLYYIEPQLGTYYVNLNNKKEPLDNPLVRKALALALDTQYLSEVVTQGTYLPAANFVGPGFYEADGTTEFMSKEVVIDRSDYEANKVAAQEALAEAGYPGGEGFPTLEYMTNVSIVHVPTAEAMAYMWKEVLGINVTIAQVDWNVFTAARRNGEHIMARDGWVADFNDPSNLLNLLTSYSGNNTTFYNNPEFDKLMEEAAASDDQAFRMEKMHEAEKLAFTEDYSAIPLYYYTTQYVARPEIKDVCTYPTGEKLFHLSYIGE